MPVPTTTQLARPLLRDHVHGQILEAIVTGVFAPGERLRDAELSAWLGVSRTPVREALLRLERAGLVIARPGSSTVVAPDDRATVSAAQQVAAALHELATRQAVPMLGGAEFAELEGANEDLAQALTAQDSVAAAAADEAFHQVFVTASANPILSEALAQVSPLLQRAVHLRFNEFFSAQESTKAHRLIIESARAGDADTAGRFARDNWLTLAK